MNDYKDIIDLAHHISKTRKTMSMYNRAAQFAPFAALNGYEDAISEIIRLTKKKIILDEESVNNLNIMLNKIEDNIKEKPLVSITYFVKDIKKIGGKYISIIDRVKRIDSVYKIIYTYNYKINLDDLLCIEML